MRLIDADELKTWFGERDLYSYDYIIGTIDSAYTVEPQCKKGKWIYFDPNGFKCSECGGYLEIGVGDVKMNFCPNCGADMRSNLS